ncbi:MAG: protein-export chaperone SecB [Magnetococcales bacterium]|nr:protein-export chaperone SecB [Magnetococcales bacterium]
MAQSTPPLPSSPSTPSAEAQNAEQPVFHVVKVYLKDLSFENPNTPDVFQITQEPRVDFNLSSNATPKEDGHFEVTLHVVTDVKLADKTMFLVDVTYAGLFLIRNVPDEHVAVLLGVDCPTILFPYLRHVISATVTEGGFKPLLLDPINFAAIFQQALAKQQAQMTQQAQQPRPPGQKPQ